MTSSADFVEPSAPGSAQAEGSQEPLPDRADGLAGRRRADRPRDVSDGVALAELKRGQCLYPVGELQPRRLLYCGKPTVPGKSWCAAHRRLCVSH